MDIASKITDYSPANTVVRQALEVPMTTRKFPRLFKTRNFGLVIGFLFALIFSLIGFSTTFFGNLESRLLDTYFAFKNMDAGREEQKGVWKEGVNPDVHSDILILGIDLKTLQRFGSWPFPRSRHAELINSLSRIRKQEDREKALFLDIFFIDPSLNAADDSALARSISESGRVFLETIVNRTGFGQSIDEEMLSRQQLLFRKTGSFGYMGPGWEHLQSNQGIQTNLPSMNATVRGYGAANVITDPWGEKVRRQPLVFKYSQFIGEYTIEDLRNGFTPDSSRFERLSWFDQTGVEHTVKFPLDDASIERLSRAMEKNAPPYVVDTDGDGNPDEEIRFLELYQDYFIPSITFSLALEYWNTSISRSRVYPGDRIEVTRGDGTEIIIPVDDQCSMIINFAGMASSVATEAYKTFPVRSYAGYVRETDPYPENWQETWALKDKIVMVGAFEKGMADDEKQTPFGMMYGIEIHANSLNTLLTGSFIRHLPRYADILIVFITTMIIAFIAARMKNLWSLPVALLFSLILFFTCSMLFDLVHILVNFTVPFAGMTFSYVTIILYRSSTEEREKKKIRAMFGKYVSPDVVAQMEDNPPELGGIDRELTVFFSDIRGFTSLSETLTPQELVKHLNEYLSVMTDIIMDTRGTLDKYVGDEIMCFWGAPLDVPDHAKRACQCALLQKRKLAELNESWPEEKRLAIGIGINSGIMTVGNMGSAGRMNYTLMGDNVNLGARLEGTNKVYGTMIIVSEYTYAKVKDDFIFRELDTIRVKGKNRPVVIYELVDER